MRSSILSPVFLILSLSSLLVHATRGLNPIHGHESKHWMGYDKADGFFFGKYQVAKDLDKKNMEDVIKLAAADVIAQMLKPSVEAPGATAVPFAINAYMGEKGVFALASSTGTGTHAEENMAKKLGSLYNKGSSLAILMPGGKSGVAEPTLMGACTTICTPLLQKHGVKDVFTKKKRSHARDVSVEELGSNEEDFEE